MNRENIKIVRDHIASLPPERFDMRFTFGDSGRVNERWYEHSVTAHELLHPCGTAACIAGWALAVLTPDSKKRLSSDDAANLFGIDHHAGDTLFMPDGFSDPGRYTQPQAVAVLDHLLATGKVDWSVALGAPVSA